MTTLKEFLELYNFRDFSYDQYRQKEVETSKCLRIYLMNETRAWPSNNYIEFGHDDFIAGSKALIYALSDEVLNAKVESIDHNDADEIVTVSIKEPARITKKFQKYYED